MKKRLPSFQEIIKHVLILNFLFPAILIAQPTQNELTTFVLVRHAEKADESRDPDLSNAGYNRAEKLAEMLERIQFNAIYSTDFRRTQKTVSPVAQMNNLDILSYDHQNPSLQVEKWLEEHEGETILISGHSNTTPAFANAILGEDSFDGNFDESDYGNILIVTISDDSDKKLLHLRY